MAACAVLSPFTPVPARHPTMLGETSSSGSAIALTARSRFLAMLRACHGGSLGTCQYLLLHGPATETRKWHKMVIDGWNLFAAASAGGNLTVMRWLAEAVAPLGWLGRICASHGVTEARNEIENVMLVACFNGHLEIVKYSPPRALPTSSWACLALAIANWQRRALVARPISMLPCG